MGGPVRAELWFIGPLLRAGITQPGCGRRIQMDIQTAGNNWLSAAVTRDITRQHGLPMAARSRTSRKITPPDRMYATYDCAPCPPVRSASFFGAARSTCSAFGRHGTRVFFVCSGRRRPQNWSPFQSNPDGRNGCAPYLWLPALCFQTGTIVRFTWCRCSRRASFRPESKPFRYSPANRNQGLPIAALLRPDLDAPLSIRVIQRPSRDIMPGRGTKPRLRSTVVASSVPISNRINSNRYSAFVRSSRERPIARAVRLHGSTG